MGLELWNHLFVILALYASRRKLRLTNGKELFQINDLAS